MPPQMITAMKYAENVATYAISPTSMPVVMT
jgi:hypothetical protein